MKLCVGITGGIGCGKSTVSNLFAERGAGIIDTDNIAHKITQRDGIAMPLLRATFGNNYIAADGGLDRAKMRSLIFSDCAAKQAIEKITHPFILDITKAQIAQLQDHVYIIIVVPLLFSHPLFQQLIQRILVVDCTEEQQVKRVMSRSRIGKVETLEIIAQQTTRAERLQRADDVIKNDTTIDALTVQVDFLHKFYSTQLNIN